MRALLDVNVLIALLDADHASHAAATDWFAEHGKTGWASCPITQNGCIRVMAHPDYPNALPVAAIVERLAQAAVQPQHEFWPDDATLLDNETVDASRIHGPGQLTDVYLLSLAVRHRGRLVTFDKAIALEPVRGAKKQHLLVL
ncbi:MAG TPA: TA system VapC family ribonuclease toxin [Usitatibacter sp.]|nr:TA system VapC family ribonuclease toxin [Usitatibacter sp.]